MELIGKLIRDPNVLGLLFLIALGIFISYQIKSKKKKVANVLSSEKKKEKKEKEPDMVEIKEFDDDEYVSGVFNSVFYSIRCDNWSREISYDKITFSRKKQVDKWNTKTISIEFEYRFESSRDHHSRLLTIKDIKLKDTSGYTSFSYKGTIQNDIKKFIYDIYAEWVSDKNNREKEKVDKSLETIKDVLGKSSERGAKLDEILGN